MAAARSISGSEHHFGRGKRIGKYELLTRLSVGGMAELFLASLAGPGGFRKFVALKLILPELRRDPDFVRMFLEEARITAAFSHANISHVFELGEHQGELYLVMEFIAGQNLEQVAQAAARRGQRLPVGFVARVVRDSCLALHYAHHFTDPAGRPAVVVHRDVTPRNLMVSFDGEAKVIDFGVAKALNRPGRTQVGQMKGTSGYMAPEQLQGRTLDGRSDLFSIGVVLHELLCGRRLFQAGSEAAVMVKTLEEPIPVPSEVDRRVSKALSDVVLRALAREPAERFSSGREMARAIEAACGPALFNEERMAGLMRELFGPRIRKTRALMEIAGSEEETRLNEVIHTFHEKDKDEEEGRGAELAEEDEGLEEDYSAPEPTRIAPAVDSETIIISRPVAPPGTGVTSRPSRPGLPARAGQTSSLDPSEELTPLPARAGAAARPGARSSREFIPPASPGGRERVATAPTPHGPPRLKESASARLKRRGLIALAGLLLLLALMGVAWMALAPLPAPSQVGQASGSAPVPSPARQRLGWLTLETTARVRVFVGSKELGTTPLRRVPLPSGSHQLRLVTPDGRARLLSADILPGKETPLSIRVESLPVQPP